MGLSEFSFNIDLFSLWHESWPLLILFRWGWRRGIPTGLLNRRSPFIDANTFNVRKWNLQSICRVTIWYYCLGMEIMVYVYTARITRKTHLKFHQPGMIAFRPKIFLLYVDGTSVLREAFSGWRYVGQQSPHNLNNPNSVSYMKAGQFNEAMQWVSCWDS